MSEKYVGFKIGEIKTVNPDFEFFRKDFRAVIDLLILVCFFLLDCKRIFTGNVR